MVRLLYLLAALRFAEGQDWLLLSVAENRFVWAMSVIRIAYSLAD